MAAAKLLAIFGTRPEAIKLLPVVTALRAHPGLETRLCATAQHRALLDQVLAMGSIRPDIDLDLMRPGQPLGTLAARLALELDKVLERERPDRVMVQGDTATAMAAALCAYHRRIPVSHVEAGLRSGNLHQPWPEEGNRRIISIVADQHFAPTRKAAETLLGEGVDPSAVHITGNTVVDALHAMQARLAADPALAQGLDALAARFSDRRIILVTAHRRENLDAMGRIADALRALAARRDTALVLPAHPNPRAGAVLKARLAGLPNVALVEPLDYPHFVRLLALSHLVLTDSGGIQEEAPALGKPVLIMRETTERPEGVEAGTARLVGTDSHRIIAEAARLLDDPHAHAAMAQAHSPFGDGHAAPRIAALVARAMSAALV